MGPNYIPHQKNLHIIIGFIGQGWFFFQKSAFQSDLFSENQAKRGKIEKIRPLFI